MNAFTLPELRLLKTRLARPFRAHSEGNTENQTEIATMNRLAASIVSGVAAGITAMPALAHQADYASLAERVSPAVVNIFTTQKQSEFAGPRGLPDGHPMQRFFERFGGPQGRPGGSEPSEALGSGFIFDAGGYVITNNHVVDNTDSVKVKLADDREFTATIIGTDERTDVALLKIDDPAALPFVSLGNSDAVRVGEDVMAVGNPFGFGGTVTTGIVSGKGRTIGSGGPYVDYIQTDASINRGNSGGPLFNMRGEVIGMNTAIFSPTGGSVGLGFSVPSNVVSRIVDDLREDGRVDRGWLGVRIQPVTDSIAAALGLPAKTGALVAGIEREAPAAATLQPGDVILSFNGVTVERSRDLPRIVGRTAPLSTVPVNVLRDGQRQNVFVTLGLLEQDRQARLVPTSIAPAADTQKLGAGLRQTPDGVSVASVAPSSIARKGGLEVGDVILQVGETPVSAPADVVSALNAAGDNAVLVLVKRGDLQVYIGLDLS